MKLVPVLILIGGVYTLHDAGFPIKETIEKFPATVKEAVISNYEKSKPVNVEKLKEEIPKVNINMQNEGSYKNYTVEEALGRTYGLKTILYEIYRHNFTSGFGKRWDLVSYIDETRYRLEVTYYNYAFSSDIGEAEYKSPYTEGNLLSYTGKERNVWYIYKKIPSHKEWVYILIGYPHENKSYLKTNLVMQWTKGSHFCECRIITNSYEDFVELWRTGVILGIFRQMPGWTDYAEDVLIDSTIRVLRATTGDVKYESKNITFSCVPSHQRHH